MDNRINLFGHELKSKTSVYPILDIPYYAQTAEFSCGPACAIMLLRHFNGSKASRQLEFEIWREVNLIGVPGCDPYSLALALIKRGLTTKIFAKGWTMPEDALIDKRFGKGSAELTRFALNQAIKRISELGVSVEKRMPSHDAVIDALKRSMVPVFMVYMHAAPHWIVIRGAHPYGYIVNDPYYDGGGREVRLSFKKLEKSVGMLKERYKINPNCLFASSPKAH